jgi:hypothetical protein
MARVIDERMTRGAKPNAQEEALWREGAERQRHPSIILGPVPSAGPRLPKIDMTFLTGDSTEAAYIRAGVAASVLALLTLVGAPYVRDWNLARHRAEPEVKQKAPDVQPKRWALRTSKIIKMAPPRNFSWL